MPTRAGRQGPAPLGYGASGIATTIGWGPSSSNRHLTSYARTTFELSDVSGATGLTLRIRGADGAAIFVNGQLAYNDNLPAALEPDLGTLAARDTAAKDIVREFRVPAHARPLGHRHERRGRRVPQVRRQLDLSGVLGRAERRCHARP